MRYGICGAMCAPMVLATASLHAGEINWHRQSDWVPGVSQGGTQNNPGPAAGGSFVWKYEWVQGGGPLGSATPWHRQPRQTMKWDGLWWSTGQGAWASDDDGSPPVMQDRIIHNLHTTTFGRTPVVSWTNPYGASTQIDLGGSLRLRWSGNNGLGYSVDVDVFMAIEDAVTGELTTILSNTYSKPTPEPSVNEEVVIPIPSTGLLTFDPGDRLILTHRGHNAFGPLGMWVSMFDNVQMTLVPTPGAAALFGVAGLALIGRRRR